MNKKEYEVVHFITDLEGFEQVCISGEELQSLRNYLKKCENLQEEIQRLNNIINELEKYLEQQWLEWKNDSNDEIVAMAQEDKAILDKLKELKEGK